MFFVIDKSKIVSYLVAICTVIILFVAATGLNNVSPANSVMTSSNIVNANEINNIVNNVNLNKISNVINSNEVN